MIPGGITGFPQAQCHSTPLTSITAGQLTYTLPLDRAPDIIQIRLVNQVAEQQWKPGDEVNAIGLITTDSGGNWYNAFGAGWSARGDENAGAGLTLFITTYATGGPIYFFAKGADGGLPRALTAASWKVKCLAIWFHPLPI